MELTKSEREAVEYAIKYYLDQATHDGESCGLKRGSIEHSVLSSALAKIQAQGNAV